MKKHILAMCSVVAVSGLTLAAQQPPTDPPPTQQTPPTQPAQRPPDPTTEPTTPRPTPRPTDPSPTSPAPTSQSPTSKTPATRESSPMSDMAKTATTVTGCLKTWDSRTMAPATGSGTGAGSAASPVTAAPSTVGGSSQFVLTNVDRTAAASRATGSQFL